MGPTTKRGVALMRSLVLQLAGACVGEKPAADVASRRSAYLLLQQHLHAMHWHVQSAPAAVLRPAHLIFDGGAHAALSERSGTEFVS
jgi:hypothetical protein